MRWATVWRYLKEKVTYASTFFGFSAFASLMVACEYVWNTYFVATRGTEPLVWGATVALGAFLFFGLLNYCWYAQSELKEEIERMSVVRARLEAQLLKRRQSSAKRR